MDNSTVKTGYWGRWCISFVLHKPRRCMNTSTVTKRPKIIFNISASSYIIFVSTLFVVLFAYTGMTKLITVREFAGTMWEVKFIRPYIDFLMYFIPSVELLIAILLSVSTITIARFTIPTRKIGLYLSAILMFAFCVYIAAMKAIYNPKDLPCSCGGIISQLNWQQHLYLNISFFVLSVVAIVIVKKNKHSIY